MTNLSLARSLNDDCVNSKAIDLMAHFLSSSPALPARILILDRRLPNFLSTLGSQDALDHPPPPHIQVFENQLTKTNSFYFPLFRANYTHWISFKVDMLCRGVTYGTFLSSKHFPGILTL